MYIRTSVNTTSSIQTLQLTEHPKSNTSMYKHKELLGHAYSLVLYNVFLYEHYPNTSIPMCLD